MKLSVIGMLSLVLINLITVPLVSPENGLQTTERNPVFRWGGMQGEYVILLDDDPAFESPLVSKVSGNSHSFGEDLDFGTYYWRVESWPAASETRKFTLDSSVAVSRTENNVKNEGNVGLLLHSMTGAFVLGVNESVEIGKDENVKAEQA